MEILNLILTSFRAFKISQATICHLYSNDGMSGTVMSWEL